MDHGVPPDIPIRNFLYMAELIKAIDEGRDVAKVNIDRYQNILGLIKQEWNMELAKRIVMQDAIQG